MFHSPLSIKSKNVAPLRKITKPVLKRWICFISSNFLHINKKKLFPSLFPIAILHKKIFISAVFEQNNFARKSAKRFKKWANNFAQNRPKLFFYYLMWALGMGNKLYKIILFYLCVKNGSLWSKFTCQEKFWKTLPNQDIALMWWKKPKIQLKMKSYF